MLRELVWTDISDVLQRTISKIDALTLNREAWAADGLIPFDRRVAVGLAAAEAADDEEKAEDSFAVMMGKRMRRGSASSRRGSCRGTCRSE